jgi:hypothetical protein
LPDLRVFPIAYITMLVLFYGLHGKAYYLVPVYPVLLAGGAIAMESWFKWTPLRWAAIGLVSIIGALLAPLAIPILPPEDYSAYARALGIPSGAASTETHEKHGSLPIYMAGQFGWREMATKVSAVYNALPPKQRAKAVFYGRDYGEASAINIYGAALHGPAAISGHNNYFLWGPGQYDGSVVIVLDNDVVPLMDNYQSARLVGHIDNPYAESWETDLPIYVLTGPRVPLNVLWPKLKHYE